MQKIERTERLPSFDEKRFGWQVSEGIANMRLRCLELALSNPRPIVGNKAHEDSIALAKRMADFVIDGTITAQDTP